MERNDPIVDDPSRCNLLLGILNDVLDDTDSKGRRRYAPYLAADVWKRILTRLEIRWLVTEAVSLAYVVSLCLPSGRSPQKVAGGIDKFLEERVPIRRPDQFRAVLEAAMPAAPAGPMWSDDEAVHIGDPARSSDATAEGIQLRFKAMPSAAATLEIMNNTLGWGRVADALAAGVGQAATRTLQEAIEPLHAEFRKYLNDALGSEHSTKHFDAIGRILVRMGKEDTQQSYWAKAVLLLTDDLFLAFWRYASTQEPSLNFRLFRQAVAMLIRYKAALEESRFRGALETGRGGDPSASATAMRLDPIDPPSSGLHQLRPSPERLVKWLFANEYRDLRNLMGELPGFIRDNEDDDPAENAPLEPVGWIRPLPPMLCRTLLRLDVFGRRQRKLGPEVVYAPQETNDYLATRDRYAALRAQLWAELLIALDMLQRHDARWRRMAAEIKGAVAGRTDDGAAVSSLTGAQRRQVNRKGFREDDADDPSVLLALAADAPVVHAVILQLDAVLARLAKADLESWWREDSEIFSRQFREIYGATPDPGRED